MATFSTNGRTRTTVADLIAAASIGAIDPSTVVLTDADGLDVSRDNVTAGGASALSSTEHDCGIAGCRHGSAHTGATQPDRQVKLSCPTCGAIARMTASALRTARHIECGNDGATFIPAARRTYNRKAV